MDLQAAEASGSGLTGLQTVLPDPGTAGFKESIIRNFPVAVAQLLLPFPTSDGWRPAAIIAFEGILIIGNEQGRRLGDEVAGTQVLEWPIGLPD